MNIYGVTTAYTLINTAWGQDGVTAGSIAFAGSGGASYTVPLIGGLNVRDHYFGSCINTTTDPSTIQAVFGINEEGHSHYDMQVFTLPSQFHAQTLTEIVFFTSGGSPGGKAFLAAATVEFYPADDVPGMHASLASVGGWSPTNGVVVGRISASGSRALVSGGDSKVHLLDLSNMAAPVALGNWTPLLQLSDATLVGNLAYVSSWESNFLSTVEIVDFSDPARPVLRGYYDTPGYAEDLEVVGTTAYVADLDGGLLILDVSDPASPRKLGGYDPNGNVQRVAVAGRYAYLAVGHWLLVLDVGNPAAPVRVGVCEMAGDIQALRVTGQKAYVAETTGALRILDVSDPGNLQVCGTYRTWGTQAVAVAGKYAYLANGGRGLEVVDVGNATNLVWVWGTVGTGTAQDVAIIGNYVVVAAAEGGLKVFELQQSLWPPLKSPVITDGMMTLSWPAMDGVRLQKTVGLTPPNWQDVPGSGLTNTVSLPMTDATSFFRLVKQ